MPSVSRCAPRSERSAAFRSRRDIHGSIAFAAGCYAIRSFRGCPSTCLCARGEMPDDKDTRDDLMTAVTLIIAETERIDRAELKV